MQQPQEIEVWYVIPAIRKELANILVKEFGTKQKKAASLLGIRESTVSQYLKEKRANELRFSEKIGQEIRKSAEALFKGSSSVIEEIQRICSLVKKEGVLCQLHRTHHRVPVECRGCLM